MSDPSLTRRTTSRTGTRSTTRCRAASACERRVSEDAGAATARERARAAREARQAGDPFPLPPGDAPPMDDATRAALVQYLLRLGDDRLVLGHRLSEWCGHAPILEE